MQVRRKLYYCVAGNFAALAALMCVVTSLNDGSSAYFRWGPNADLVLISVPLNTWARWWCALLFIGILRVCDVWVNEIGSPILGFSVYNPDKKHITEFTKNELHFLANSMWAINSLRGIFMTIVTVTQIDLAFASVVVSELASICATRMLLNEKTFSRAPHSELDALL